MSGEPPFFSYDSLKSLPKYKRSSAFRNEYLGEFKGAETLEDRLRRVEREMEVAKRRQIRGELGSMNIREVAMGGPPDGPKDQTLINLLEEVGANIDRSVNTKPQIIVDDEAEELEDPLINRILEVE